MKVFFLVNREDLSMTLIERSEKTYEQVEAEMDRTSPTVYWRQKYWLMMGKDD